MNTLDVKPPSNMRRSDASAPSSDGDQREKASTAFGSVLVEVSEAEGRGRGAAPFSAPAAPAGEPRDHLFEVADSSKGAGSASKQRNASPVDHLLQAFLPDATQDPSDPNHAAAATENALLAGLESLLPRLFPTMASGSPNGGGSNLLRAGQIPNTVTGAIGTLPSNAGAAINVAVQNQETHFKPIVEGFSLKPAGPASTGISVNPSVDDGSMETQGAGKASHGVMISTHPRAEGSKAEWDEGGRQDAFAAGASSIAHRRSEELREGSPGLSRTTRLEAGSTGEIGARPDAGVRLDAASSLPPAMLQRISSAIIEEAKQLSPQSRNLGPEGAVVLSTSRATEGVVRMLSIQLHPADLGLVTIKMKLSGDNLEMDVQVASEETARMLRHDTEKLSALLRGSGYRPEQIHIHTGQMEPAQLDGFHNQRQQSQFQSQQEAFQQGAGHGDHPQRRDDNYGTEGNEGYGENNPQGDSADRNIGGVYL